MLTVTNTNITMIWTLPSFAPSEYLGFHRCKRLCEQTQPITFTPSGLIKSPYTITGIDPGSFCTVEVIGQYFDGQSVLAIENAITLSSGKV